MILNVGQSSRRCVIRFDMTPGVDPTYSVVLNELGKVVLAFTYDGGDPGRHRILFSAPLANNTIAWGGLYDVPDMLLNVASDPSAVATFDIQPCQNGTFLDFDGPGFLVVEEF